MEFYSAIKNEFTTFAGKWVDLELKGKVSQTQIYSIIQYTFSTLRLDVFYELDSLHFVYTWEVRESCFISEFIGDLGGSTKITDG